MNRTFLESIPEKRIVIDDIRLIINREFISKNVGYIDNDDPVVLLTNNEVNKWFYYSHDDKIIEFSFDEVVIIKLHPSVDYSFKLNTVYNQNIHYNKFAPTIEELKSIKINDFKREIERINMLNKGKKELLGKIKNLENYEMVKESF